MAKASSYRSAAFFIALIIDIAGGHYFVTRTSRSALFDLSFELILITFFLLLLPRLQASRLLELDSRAATKSERKRQASNV